MVCRRVCGCHRGRGEVYPVRRGDLVDRLVQQKIAGQVFQVLQPHQNHISPADWQDQILCENPAQRGAEHHRAEPLQGAEIDFGAAIDTIQRLRQLGIGSQERIRTLGRADQRHADAAKDHQAAPKGRANGKLGLGNGRQDICGLGRVPVQARAFCLTEFARCLGGGVVGEVVELQVVPRDCVAQDPEVQISAFHHAV